MRFEDHDRERAKLWIINNQLGRRNLHLLDQGRLREEEYKITQNIGLQKRNANLKHSTIEVENLPHREAGRTRDIIGKELGVSGKQYDKIKEVNQKAAPETIQRIRDGEQSINSAWLEIKEKERKQEDSGCAAYMRHIPVLINRTIKTSTAMPGTKRNASTALPDLFWQVRCRSGCQAKTSIHALQRTALTLCAGSAINALTFLRLFAMMVF